MRTLCKTLGESQYILFFNRAAHGVQIALVDVRAETWVGGLGRAHFQNRHDA